MILALDAGNSRIKWGLWANGFVAQGSLPSADAVQLFDALHVHAPASRAIGSNVAGGEVRARIEQALQPWHLAPEWISSCEFQCGVHNGYAAPGQLGSDRWAALVGAHARGPGDALVVNCGTAVTVDALTASGEFLGGLILPGVHMMARALSQGTAGLPLEPGAFHAFPDNTASAIHSGAVQAICGAVDRMRAALSVRTGGEVAVLMSGGAAPVLAPHLHATVLAPNLVLEGLVEIARE